MVVPLAFGVFPLGLAGSPDGLAAGPPDDYEAIGRAVAELEGGPPFMPRMYVNWTGASASQAALAQVAGYAAQGLPWDLVLCYRDPPGDVAAWASFVGRVVAEHGSRLAAVQVTAEANLSGIPAAADGAFPGGPGGRLRADLNVTHWELFALRDADGSRDGLFCHFGVLRDDYSAKPAFGVLRDLIAELSAPAGT